MWFILLSSVLALLLSALIWWVIASITHPVNTLPGPFAFPFIGNTWMFLSERDAALEKFNAYSRKYAPLYRTWHGPRPVVHPLDPKNVELILSSNQHINKSFDYSFLSDWLGNGLLISSGSKWHSRRKLLTQTFHFNILEQFLPVFCDKSKILLSKLNAYIDRNEGVNIVPLITRCTLDIICQTAMGTNVNAQEDIHSQYVDAVCTFGDLFVYRMVRPWLWPSWLFKMTKKGREYQKCINILHTFSRTVIHERRSELNQIKMETKINEKLDEGTGIKRKIAFLDLLLQASENDPTLTNEEIREEVDTFMFEGHDTTAVAISWILFFIGCYMDVQSRCREELTYIFSSSDRDPSLTDLGNMKYLERVIKETLRLRPSVYMIYRQLYQPFTLGNIRIPIGTKLNIQIMNIHRNPEIYPQPEKFDPDRFLTENCQGRHPYAYIPFSAGPRNCIGQKFAMLEMKEVVSSILRKYNIETIDPSKHYAILPDMLARPKYGVQLKLSSIAQMSH